jgi:hypothetical protein
MSGPSVKAQRRREGIRTKLQRSVERRLEPGEVITLWVLGMTAPIPTNGIEGLVNLGRIAGGKARPAGVLLTDRAIHVARTAWFRSRVLDLIASYPLEPHPPQVEFEQTSAIRGVLTVNNTTVYLPSVQLETAEQIIRQSRT